MTSRLTPDGRHGADTLCAIRQRMESSPGPVLRAEELAMLQGWYKECADPARRRELRHVIEAFGGAAPKGARKPRFPIHDA